jgi:hypothetical protein
MRRFENGHYWVQHTRNGEPEVAMHEDGRWRIGRHSDLLRAQDFARIGRKVVAPADAFDDEIERDGELGV